MPMPDKLIHYCHLMRLNKPVGSLLLLWPTLWALWLAGDGKPHALHVAIFITGVFLMRSAGCVINDYADRNIDGKVKRTAQRPLAIGAVTEKEALCLFAGLMFLALLLVIQLNGLAIIYAIVGGVLAITYPFLKRFTHLPQAYLGIAFGWGIPMAYAAELNTVPLEAWLLLVANILWALAYDTEYAMVDRDDDIKIGVKSSAILFGGHDRTMVGFFHVCMLLVLTYIGVYYHLSAYFYLGLFLAMGSVLWQLKLIRYRQREQCFSAFLNNTWLGAAVFTGIVLAYLP